MAALQLLAAHPPVKLPLARKLVGLRGVEPLAVQLQTEGTLPLREPKLLKAPLMM